MPPDRNTTALSQAGGEVCITCGSGRGAARDDDAWQHEDNAGQLDGQPVEVRQVGKQRLDSCGERGLGFRVYLGFI